MLVSLSGCILKLENKKLIVCNMTAGTLFFTLVLRVAFDK